MRRTAASYFCGEETGKRLNCIQAITLAFAEDRGDLEERVKRYKQLGKGKAPGKVCGAFYGAQLLLEERSPSLIDALKDFFARHAGSLLCREIRKSRKASCLRCVELASEFLEQQREEPVPAKT